MQASLPSGSASTQNAGAASSLSRRAAGGDRRVDPRMRRLVRHVDVEVDPVALRPRRVHLLEPDRGATSERVDQAADRSDGPGSST